MLQYNGGARKDGLEVFVRPRDVGSCYTNPPKHILHIHILHVIVMYSAIGGFLSHVRARVSLAFFSCPHREHSTIRRYSDDVSARFE